MRTKGSLPHQPSQHITDHNRSLLCLWP